MKNNLELHKQITFDELVKHGIENGANIILSPIYMCLYLDLIDYLLNRKP